MDQPAPRRRPAWLWPALTAIVVLGVYTPTLRYGFVYDDYHLCYRVPWGEVARAFVGPWNRHGIESPYYRPITILSFALDARVYGISAAGYHFTNLLLHAAAVCLLFVLAKRLGLCAPACALAALAFGLSPLAAPAASWISERTDSLATVFFLASCLAWYGYRRSGKWVHYTWATVFMVLAMGSKETAVFLPATLVLMDVLLFARPRFRWRWEWAPLLGILLGYVGLSILLIDAQRSIPKSALNPMTAITTCVRMTKFAWVPVDAYDSLWAASHAAFPIKTRLPWPQTLLYWLTVAFLLATIRRMRPRTRRTLAFAVWASLLNVVPLIIRPDIRLLYLTSALATIGLAAMLDAAWRRPRLRVAGVAACGVIVVSYVVLMLPQRAIFAETSPHMVNLDIRVCSRWFDQLSRPQARYLRAKLMRHAQALDDAIRQIESANPPRARSPAASLQLGRLYHARGLCIANYERLRWFDLAIAEFRRVLAAPAPARTRQRAQAGLAAAQKEKAGFLALRKR